MRSTYTKPLLDPTRASVNDGNEYAVVVSSPEPEEEVKPTTVASLPEALLTIIAEYSTTRNAYGLFQALGGNNWQAAVEKFCNEKPVAGFNFYATLPERATEVVAYIDRDMRSLARKYVIYNTIYSRHAILPAICLLASLTIAGLGAYYGQKNLVEFGELREKSNELYPVIQTNRSDIFNFTTTSEGKISCTIIPNLPCYTNCSDIIKNCDVLDPYFLNCANIEYKVNSFGYYYYFVDQWADMLRMNDPIPYSTSLDHRFMNSSEPSIPMFINICEASVYASFNYDKAVPMSSMSSPLFLLIFIGLMCLRKDEIAIYRRDVVLDIEALAVSTFIKYYSSKPELLRKWMLLLHQANSFPGYGISRFKNDIESFGKKITDEENAAYPATLCASEEKVAEEKVAEEVILEKKVAEEKIPEKAPERKKSPIYAEFFHRKEKGADEINTTPTPAVNMSRSCVLL